MMPDDMFTPEEAALIQRLREASQPELKPLAFESIRQKVLRELDTPPHTIPRHTPRSYWVVLVLAEGVLILVLLIVMMFLLVQRQKDLGTPSITPSATFTATAVPDPSPLSTVEAAPALPTQQVFQPQSTATMTRQGNSVITATAVMPQEQVILVLEGPVQKITDDGIVVFDMDIRLAPNDPILELIEVGMIVYVEGYPETINGVTIIMVVNIEIQNDQRFIATRPPSGSGLPPGCKMSKNGRIKCSKKK